MLFLFLACGLLVRGSSSALNVLPLPECDTVCGLDVPGLRITSSHKLRSPLDLVRTREKKYNGIYEVWTSRAHDFMKSIGMNLTRNCTTEYANLKVGNFVEIGYTASGFEMLYVRRHLNLLKNGLISGASKAPTNSSSSTILTLEDRKSMNRNEINLAIEKNPI